MIFLGIGSNLPSKYGDRFDNINLAISLLESYGIKIISKSSCYETPSYPDIKKPKFINIVVSVESHLPPEDLMSVLIHIEEKLERVRVAKNDPRTCDIDIIDYNGEIKISSYRNEEFVMPHKELSSRNFVLFPLKEIASNWKHPKSNKTIDELIDNLTKDEKNSILKIKKN